MSDGRPAASASSASRGPTKNLFVAGFKNDVNDEALRRLFSPFGDIVSAKVMLDIHTGANRGFGFVLFADLDAAVAARTALDGSVHEHPSSERETFKLVVNFAKHDAFNVVRRSTKVYCRNIPTTMDDAAVKRALEDVVGEGTVANVSLHPDSTRSPALYDRARHGNTTATPAPAENRAAANVAFVEFVNADLAQAAVDKTYRLRLDGPGSEGPLLTKLAETAQVKSERMKRAHQTNTHPPESDASAEAQAGNSDDQPRSPPPPPPPPPPPHTAVGAGPPLMPLQAPPPALLPGGSAFPPFGPPPPFAFPPPTMPHPLTGFPGAPHVAFPSPYMPPGAFMPLTGGGMPFGAVPGGVAGVPAFPAASRPPESGTSQRPEDARSQQQDPQQPSGS